MGVMLEHRPLMQPGDSPAVSGRGRLRRYLVHHAHSQDMHPSPPQLECSSLACGFYISLDVCLRDRKVGQRQVEGMAGLEGRREGREAGWGKIIFGRCQAVF